MSSRPVTTRPNRLVQPVGRLAIALFVLVLVFAAGLVASPQSDAQQHQDSREHVVDDELLARWADFIDAGQERADGEPDGAVTTGQLQITNGTDAVDGEFPFLVLALVELPDGIGSCGGVLITASTVLTAAHCLVGAVEDGDVFVGLGSVDINQLDFIDVDSYEVHPAYASGALDDIAILNLAEPANLADPNIATIPYGRALSGGADAGSMTVIGWGDTDGNAGENNVTFPDIAQKVDVSLRPCDLDILSEDDWNNLCAFDANGKDSCQGDSGGPAVQRVDGVWTVVGLVSLGPDGSCGQIEYGIYQRVAPHDLWIQNPTENPLLCFGEWVTIDLVLNGGDGNGTDSDDVIAGTDGPDQIIGGAGNDLICGFGGNDKLFGRQGLDWIDGGEGDDVIHGNRGNDLLVGNTGNDRIFGYAGNDFIEGKEGNDRLHGNFGDDLLFGGAGNDNMFGYGDDDRLEGGGGADLLVGNFGDDTLLGQGGDDTMFGSDGTDVMLGGQGNDAMQGNSGNDAMQGGAGNDAMDGGINQDYCEGNAGTDTATRCETAVGFP